MRKLLLLFLIWVYPIVGFSAIDECKTDIYYANGITTKRDDAKYVAERILGPTILKEKFNGDETKMKKHIGEVGFSYNQTNGFVFDGMETYSQKLDIQIYIDLWLRLKGYISTHLEDVEEHIKKYSNRIKLGHKVLVIAHSQGNLFTNEIYKALGKRSENAWMQDYFGAVSVASPMKADIKNDTERITWDNDGVGRLIAHNGSVDPDEVSNPIRSVEWEYSPDYNSFDGTAEVIPTPYARQTQVGKVVGVGNERFGYLGHKAIEDGLDFPAFNVHAFTFYMGEPLSRDVEVDIPLVPFADGKIVKKAFKDPFDQNKTLQTNKAKDLIVSAIKEQLDLLDKVDSQWTTDQEYDKNTCDYKITLKHQYDPSIEMGTKVYPFNASKKLYQVNGEYVKASCGGENIIDLQDNNSSECWMIDNPEEEKIGFGKTIKFYAYFNFSFDNDYYTWPYMSSSFIADTYSTEITSLAQWREIRPNQRECRTQSGITGGSNSGYFYFNSDVTVKRIEDIHIFGGHYNLQPYKYTIKCILNKNQKNLDDIEKIEKGKVTYEQFHGSNNSPDGIYFIKLYLIEYFIHTK